MHLSPSKEVKSDVNMTSTIDTSRTFKENPNPQNLGQIKTNNAEKMDNPHKSLLTEKWRDEDAARLRS